MISKDAKAVVMADITLVQNPGHSHCFAIEDIRSEDFLYDDEERLHSFLSLSEQKKEDFNGKYKVRNVELLHQLHFIGVLMLLLRVITMRITS